MLTIAEVAAVLDVDPAVINEDESSGYQLESNDSSSIVPPSSSSSNPSVILPPKKSCSPFDSASLSRRSRLSLIPLYTPVCRHLFLVLFLLLNISLCCSHLFL